MGETHERCDESFFNGVTCQTTYAGQWRTVDHVHKKAPKGSTNSGSNCISYWPTGIFGRRHLWATPEDKLRKSVRVNNDRSVFEVDRSRDTAKTTALQAANMFLDHWVMPYGIQSFLFTDNGPEFLNKLFTTFCIVLDLKRLITTAYHPQVLARQSNIVAP